MNSAPVYANARSYMQRRRTICCGRAGMRAVAAAVAKFGRIDVLVNNAGNVYAGFFEELSPEQF